VTQHLTDQEIQSYTKGHLSPEKLLAADDHLSSCEVCRTKAMSSINLQESFTSLTTQIESAEHHLSYRQLTQWIDGQTDHSDKESLGNHLKNCELCAAEERDLRKFVQSRKEATASTHFWKRDVSLTWLHAAAAIAVIGSAGLFFFWHTQNRIEQLQSELQHSKSEIADLRKAAVNQTATILSLQDGERQIIMDANGNLKGLPALETDFLEPIKRSLQTLDLQIPSIPAELTPPKGQLLGASKELKFSPIHPYGSIVLSDRPEFRWHPMPNAKSYEVAIYDSKYQEVLRSGPLFETSWIAEKTLNRGEVYSWQITAEVNGRQIMTPVPPAPEAKFKILEAVIAARLEEAKSRAGGSHLLLGVLYAEAGLMIEAEREFVALKAANPESPVPNKLLQQVTHADLLN
jgi:hypothetical protein